MPTGWNGLGGRQILRIGAHIERSGGVAPDLPRGLRSAQALEKPLLLLEAENSLRRRGFIEVFDRLSAVGNSRGRVAVVISAAGVEDFHGFFGHQLRKIVAGEGSRFAAVQRLL
jgi:hypothetical protein